MNRTHTSGALLTLAMAACLSSPAASQWVTIDLSQWANARIQNYQKGADSYPEGRVMLGGVPFEIRAVGGKNAWNSKYVKRPFPHVLEVPIGVDGVIEVHTLISTFFGQPGPECFVHLEFLGSEGARYERPLIGGVDVRDHNHGNFTNEINGTTTKNVFSSGSGTDPRIRIDKQQIVLPPVFAGQRLLSMRLKCSGRDKVSLATLQGLTVRTTMEAVAKGRKEVPGDTALADALQRVKTAYDSGQARSESARGKLAEEMLAAAIGRGHDDVERYALLVTAYELAVKAGDLVQALAAFDARVARYRVPLAVAKSELARIGNSAQRSDAPWLVSSWRQFSASSAAAGNYADAHGAAQQAEGLARKWSCREQASELIDERKHVDAMLRWQHRAKAASDRLLVAPGDAAAHRVIGEFHGFGRGDWPCGLTHLAKGDGLCVEIARKDAASPGDARAQVALADLWWEFAGAIVVEQDCAAIARRRVRERARHWYSIAVSHLEGTDRTRAERRLAAAD